MTLTAGTRLGPYEVVSPLGAGGMGEVYRARDTSLNRDVALKVLPDAFASDPERLARFEREAQLLASLNHPNIAAIYGLQEGVADPNEAATGPAEAGHDVRADTVVASRSSRTIRALVLELVEGATLADRIAGGPLSLEEALPIARQIVDALDAAHEQGIIHRDLKPANIKVRPDGTVKVLDFGLAKALDPVLGSGEVSQSPTITTPAMTRAGMVLGTAAYMSPEQARGRQADKRSDVWAFGCVLYEMLTGTRVFDADGMSDTIAAVLRAEPDWTRLPPHLPESITRLLKRCLEKDPKRRLRDIGDARLEFEDTSHARMPGEKSRAQGAWWGRERVAWITAGVCFVALVAALAIGRFATSAADGETYQSSIILPDGVRFSGFNPAGRFALSPDGRRLAFVASDATGRSMLWVRPLDIGIAQPLAGTDSAAFPFWSPDSRFIGFVAQGKLKTIAASGGPPRTVCDVSSDAFFGATSAWNRDDVILFTPAGGSPVYRVSAAGGTPIAATTLDAANGDAQHWFPFFLPDGRHFIYFAVGTKTGGVTDPRGVYVGSLDPAESGKLLLEIGSNAKYAEGYLFFLRGTTLLAQPFDVGRLELEGEAVTIAEGVQGAGSSSAVGAAGAFTLSDTGLLAYQTGSNAIQSRLLWFDRAGRQLGTLGDEGDYGDVALSPDGSRAAVSFLDLDRDTRDLWLYDVARGLGQPFTSDPDEEFAPAWSPTGDRLVYSARRKGSYDLYQKASSGAGREDLLLGDSLGKFQGSWSRDGRYFVYVAGGGTVGRSDLWVLPTFGDRKPFPFLETSAVETHGQFSPDGRSIAYSSMESGRLEVYVAEFQGKGGRVRVSAAGGGWPRWRRDGRELFYIAADDMLTAVSVTGQGADLAIGAARPLFVAHLHPFASPHARLDAYAYDVSPDGQRFLINPLIEETASRAVTLVVNWPAAVRK